VVGTGCGACGSRGVWTIALACVLAFALGGCGSSETEEAVSGASSPRPSTGDTVQPDLSPPSTPTSLTATAVAPAQVNLSWPASDDDVGVTGYRIFRGGALLTTVAGGATTYQDTTVVGSTTYSYTVQARDAAGNFSGHSPAAIVSTPATLDTTAPTVPTGLTATAVSLSQINVSWTASTDNVGVTGYRIVRNGVPLVDVPGNVTSYENRGLQSSTTYIYTVRALDAAGNLSAVSNAASATTLAAPDTVPPTAPSNLSANAVSPTEVNLSWSPATDNVVVAGYRIYRDGVLLISVAGTTHQDAGLAPSTMYSYNVDAVDGDGNVSPLSPTATVTTLALPDTTAPSTPTNLTATAVSSSQINLSWTASTDNLAVTAYRIFRNGTLIDTVGNVTTYQNTGLNAGTTYSYRIRALDAAGNVSGLSAQASATTQSVADTSAPTTPTGLSANSASASQINLTWNASTDNVAVTGYRIYRNGVFLVALGVVTAFSDVGLSASTTYSYNVDAIDAAGNASGISNTASATTQASGGTPGTPSISGVTGTFSQGQSITISGSSFETKGHSGPMLWDDFDGGSNGSSVGGTTPLIHQGNLASYSRWEKWGGGDHTSRSILFNNSNPKVSSTLHASATFSNNSYWGLYFLIPYTQFTTGNELYISFYYRFRKQSASFGRQTKAWIAYPPTGSDKAYWTNSFGTCQSGNFWRTHRTESPDEHQLSPGLSATGIDNEWVRFESYLKQSSPGVANGAWHQVVYRPSLGTPAKHVVTLNNYKMRDTSANWTDWAFGGAYYDMCGSTETATIDVDDFYMDSTRARVEVCNSSTWSARTRCELQLPTAWSDASITATFKKGYLPSSTTAYVYVINAAGNVNSAGFPITVAP
jgi:chitodextrinase